jgi:hypothetical protein
MTIVNGTKTKKKKMNEMLSGCGGRGLLLSRKQKLDDFV